MVVFFLEDLGACQCLCGISLFLSLTVDNGEHIKH